MIRRRSELPNLNQPRDAQAFPFLPLILPTAFEPVTPWSHAWVIAQIRSSPQPCFEFHFTGPAAICVLSSRPILRREALAWDRAKAELNFTVLQCRLCRDFTESTFPSSRTGESSTCGSAAQPLMSDWENLFQATSTSRTYGN